MKHKVKIHVLLRDNKTVSSKFLILLMLKSIGSNYFWSRRYIRFLSVFDSKSTKKSRDNQKHHILLKSVFPQCSDLNVFSWNGVMLSRRSHGIAHRLLYKANPGNKRIRYAYICMHTIHKAYADKGASDLLKAENSRRVDSAETRYKKGASQRKIEGCLAEKILKLYEDGCSAEEISKIIDVSLSSESIRRYLRKQGVEVRSRSDALKIRRERGPFKKPTYKKTRQKHGAKGLLGWDDYKPLLIHYVMTGERNFGFTEPKILRHNEFYLGKKTMSRELILNILISKGEIHENTKLVGYRSRPEIELQECPVCGTKTIPLNIKKWHTNCKRERRLK